MAPFSTTTFALDDGDVGVLLPPGIGWAEDDRVLIERRADGVIVITRIDPADEVDEP